MAIALAAVLLVLALGGAALAFAGDAGQRSQKRVAAVAKASPAARAARSGAEVGAVRRKNVQNMLKDFESRQAEKKQKVTIRRRLDQAGLNDVSPRTFWIATALLAAASAFVCVITGQSLLVAFGSALSTGFGLPRWVLGFLKARREKRFTDDFAGAIDVIVRSVKSGLPTNDALKIVGSEFRDPVGSEFRRLCEGAKMGVTLEQGLKRMYESMPTTEVGFFMVVMTIQQKSGGNLSEALGNLAGVLRDRKRLQGKIKAMSSEATASAGIIGSLPPAVMGIVYLTTPNYISILFTDRIGNLMLAACVIWMSIGIFVMRKMINFKH
ncbi:MAG: type II secretion system F family protein [Alphaproteobacteria bacterium]|nr:type II secretion system F family protein [Alphaproteobacteria bacterium]MDE2493312.1 type II secretion system F family protein [Alphaproteobacteria bacterium]